MSAYIVTGDNRGFVLHGSYRTEEGAVRQLLRRLGSDCFEIRLIGAERAPREDTLEWLTAACREVTVC